ncbi:hypothetical protein TW95_gp1720 [Pandoravirus inopinatum]|uniref:Uncharacterized protein n=1 Tax=Pandoravirus inopinatum TaxID=1605721 RepID=A0A0B5J498_9VIRU|nr:hypothetical protein TW95_gp1720 [Pandoravirus inopinatum]AJF98454.1 hypothetical protein [Pandoravirus inopinatum]
MALVRFGETTPLGRAKAPAATPATRSSNPRDRRPYVGRLGHLLATTTPSVVARSLWQVAHIGRVNPSTARSSHCALRPMVQIDATRADRPPLDEAWRVATTRMDTTWCDDMEAILAWLDGPGRKEAAIGHFARTRLLDDPSTLVVEIIWRHSLSGDVLCIDLGAFCDAMDRSHCRDGDNATPFTPIGLFWFVIMIMVTPALACGYACVSA